jgi:hypothetical protein
MEGSGTTSREINNFVAHKHSYKQLSLLFRVLTVAHDWVCVEERGWVGEDGAFELGNNFLFNETVYFFSWFDFESYRCLILFISHFSDPVAIQKNVRKPISTEY